MDFGNIIKRAWQITWRYKALWVLGLFAGATGSSYSSGWGGSGYRYDAQDFGRFGPTEQFSWDSATWLQDWVPVLIAIGVLALLVGLLWLVLSLAAQTGLASQVNRAEEGQNVSAGEGWAVGFHYWGRAFLVGLTLMLPILVLGLAFAVPMTLMFVVPLLEGSSPSWAGIAGLVGLGILAVPVFIVLGFVLGNMYVLAIRYIAIEDRTAADAVRGSWWALRHRFKDVFLMWLITLGLGIAFGLAMAIPAVIAGIGIAVTAVVGAWPIAVVLGIALFVLVVVLSAGWNTFTSAMWTIFFRRLTGRAAPQVQPAPAYAYPYGAPTQPPYPPPYPPPTAPYPAPPVEPPIAPPAGPPEPPPEGPPVAGYAPAPSADEAPPAAGASPAEGVPPGEEEAPDAAKAEPAPPPDAP